MGVGKKLVESGFKDLEEHAQLRYESQGCPIEQLPGKIVKSGVKKLSGGAKILGGMAADPLTGVPTYIQKLKETFEDD